MSSTVMVFVKAFLRAELFHIGGSQRCVFLSPPFSIYHHIIVKHLDRFKPYNHEPRDYDPLYMGSSLNRTQTDKRERHAFLLFFLESCKIGTVLTFFPSSGQVLYDDEHPRTNDDDIESVAI